MARIREDRRGCGGGARYCGIINEPGHAQPRIIAMSDAPGYLPTPEYGARWGIEPMFADFRSRGFGLERSQLRAPDPRMVITSRTGRGTAKSEMCSSLHRPMNLSSRVHQRGVCATVGELARRPASRRWARCGRTTRSRPCRRRRRRYSRGAGVAAYGQHPGNDVRGVAGPPFLV